MAGMFAVQKGVVQAVSAGRREVRGTLTTGAEFVAYYYGATPVVGDIVFVSPVADGSWIVITGPTTAQGLFGVGGDGNVTITYNTAADTASRTTSGDGTYARDSAAPFTVSSASAAFTSADVGAVISGTGIASGSVITTVNSSTQVTISQPVTSTQTTAVLTIYQAYTPIRWTKSGSEFSLARDLYCTNLTLSAVDGVFTLCTNGYRIFCLGTLYIDSGITVHNNGYPASGATAGGNARAGTIGRAVGAGANGLSGNGSGTTPSAVTASIATLSTNAVQSGGYGGYTYAGAAFSRDGGYGGTIINALTNGWPAYVPKIVTVDQLAGTTLFAGGNGGGSGGLQADSAGTGRSGAGGGGGGVVGIYARQLVNFGTISANGGAGSAGTVGTDTDGGFGGGGGGGGGAIVLVYGATGTTLGQITAAGGSAGGGFAGTGGLGSSVTSTGGFYSIDEVSSPDYVPSGGGGGAAAQIGGTYTAVAGGDGKSGLIWAIPL